MEQSAFVIAQCPHTFRVLMGKKRKKRPLWSFFGGHLNPKESPRDAALREFKEETGIKLHGIAADFADALYFPKKVIWVFRARIYFQFPVRLSQEHLEHHWFDPYDLPALSKLTPTARKIITVRMSRVELIHNYQNGGTDG